MCLELETLYLVNFLTASIISLVLLIIWRMQISHYSLGWLSLGFSSLMLGALLRLNAELLPDFISIVCAYTLYLLWIVFIWQAICNFQKIVLPLQKILLSLLLYVSLLLYYLYINFDTSICLIVFLLLAVIYSIFCLRDISKSIQINSAAIEYKILGAAASIFTLSLFLLLYLSLFASTHGEYEWAGGNSFEQWIILIFILYSVAFALLFLWLMQRDFEYRGKECIDALKNAHASTEQLRQEAENAALHDPLTLVGNRRKFENTANLERQRHLRHHHDLCVAFIDIDNFKEVNDKFGHDIGDQVLKLLVTYFMDIIRNIDMVYRWGGEEFLILLPETDLKHAAIVCERIREHIESALIVQNECITISIGVSQLNEQESINSLVKRADKLLYTAKKNGRNCVVDH